MSATEEIVGHTYHVGLDLRAAMQMTDRELRHCLKRGDKQLTPDECREVFIEALRKGYDVLTCCENVDEKGMCKGHPPAKEPTP